MGTGFRPFDRTVQETNLWLKEIEDDLKVDRPKAYAGLRAALHTLRDRLPPETALHFADQLPVLLRGVAVEAWKLSKTPTRIHTVEAFAKAIENELPPDYPLDGEAVARASFRAMVAHMDYDEVSKVISCMPAGLRDLWSEEGD